METQNCSVCKTEYPASLEYFGKHKVRGLDTYCKSCRQKHQKEYYYKNKEKMMSQSRDWKKIQRQKINEYKDSKCCVQCGESRNWVLDFHHPDPNEKEFQISQGESYGWKKVKKEIEKCIILCSNCHRDLHYNEKLNIK